MTPTARTLEKCRRDGYCVDVVERWIPGANIRRDLFGCVDVLCIKKTEPFSLLGIQATTASTVSSRVRKIVPECSEAAGLFLLHGELQVWGWRRWPDRVDGRLWRPRVEHITADMLE